LLVIVASSSNNMEKEVATVAGGYPQDRHEANANLIAASPYLYLALKLLLSAIAGAGSLEDARDVAEMALAKADTRVDS
jgi:hypothetical protein